jgi:hypothetical protein
MPMPRECPSLRQSDSTSYYSPHPVREHHGVVKTHWGSCMHPVIVVLMPTKAREATTPHAFAVTASLASACGTNRTQANSGPPGLGWNVLDTTQWSVAELVVRAAFLGEGRTGDAIEQLESQATIATPHGIPLRVPSLAMETINGILNREWNWEVRAQFSGVAPTAPTCCGRTCAARLT